MMFQCDSFHSPAMINHTPSQFLHNIQQQWQLQVKSTFIERNRNSQNKEAVQGHQMHN